MTELTKKGVYLRPEQVEILAKLIYESRKIGKRHISESMLIRVAIEMLMESKLDILAYQSEEEVLKAIKSMWKT